VVREHLENLCLLENLELPCFQRDHWHLVDQSPQDLLVNLELLVVLFVLELRQHPVNLELLVLHPVQMYLELLWDLYLLEHLGNLEVLSDLANP
jgi:hypothetical protein